MTYTTKGYDKDSLRTHFATAVDSRVFPSPTEIKYCVYSRIIWERFCAAVAKQDTVVDLGCGGGTALYCLESLGYSHVFGLDFVRSIPDGFLRRTTFVEGDILNAPFEDGSFDAVISTQVIEHVEDTRFVAEVRRLLRRGGVALVTSVLKGPYAWYFWSIRDLHG